MKGLTQKLEFTGDRRLDQAQKNLHPVIEALNANPLTPNAGAHIKGALLTAGASTTLVHGLGRKVFGWTVTRVLGNPNGAVEVSSDETRIVLSQPGALGDTTIDLWVF